MRKLAILLAACTAASASPAFAQVGLGPSFYVGPVVGYDSVKSSAGDESESDSGIVYGVVAGADFDLAPGAFIGIEGEYNGSTVDTDMEDILVAGDEGKIEAGRTLYVGSRIGAQLAGLKIYGKGGYINSKFNSSYTDTVTLTSNDDLDGFLIGAGAETQMGLVRLRGEYRYVNYGEPSYFGIDTGAEASRHQLMVGALFGF